MGINVFKDKAEEGTFKRMAQDLVQLPVTLATLPVDLVTNPMNLAGPDGRLNFGSVFSLEERKKNADIRKQQQEFLKKSQDLKVQLEGLAAVKGFSDLITGARTDEEAQSYTAGLAPYQPAGADTSWINSALSATGETRGAAQQAAVAGNIPEPLSRLLTAQEGVTAGVRAVQDERALERAQAMARFSGEGTAEQDRIYLENVRNDPVAWESLSPQQQAGINRGLESGGRGLKNAVSETTRSLGRPEYMRGAASERQAKKALGTLTQMVEQNIVPTSLASRAKVIVSQGDVTNAKSMMEEIDKVTRPGEGNYIPSGNALLADPDLASMLSPEILEQIRIGVEGGDNEMLKPIMGAAWAQLTSWRKDAAKEPAIKEAMESVAASEGARLGLEIAVNQYAVVPSPENPEVAIVDPALFSRSLAVLLPNDPGYQSAALSLFPDKSFVQRKTQLIGSMQRLIADYVKSISGAQASEGEAARLARVMPTGNEATAAQFEAKARIAADAMSRNSQVEQLRAEIIRDRVKSGVWDGVLDRSEQARINNAARDSFLETLDTLEGLDAKHRKENGF